MARTEKMNVCFLLFLRKDSYGELHPFLTPQISWVLSCRLKAFHPKPPWHWAIPTTTPPTRLSSQQSPDCSPRLCPGDPGGQTQRLSLSCIPRPEFLSQIGVLLSLCCQCAHLIPILKVPLLCTLIHASHVSQSSAYGLWECLQSQAPGTSAVWWHTFYSSFPGQGSADR